MAAEAHLASPWPLPLDPASHTCSSPISPAYFYFCAYKPFSLCLGSLLCPVNNGYWGSLLQEALLPTLWRTGYALLMPT